jgi:hypothetical protein
VQLDEKRALATTAHQSEGKRVPGQRGTETTCRYSTNSEKKQLYATSEQSEVIQSNDLTISRMPAKKGSAT